MNLELTGKNVVITGASKGIGLAIAHAFAAQGARVALIARNPETLEIARQQLLENGHEAAIISTDLTDPIAAGAAIADAEAQLGGLDILINSAGAARRTEPELLDAHAWRAALDAKFFPYIHAQDAVLSRLLARAKQSGEPLSGAAIVNIVGTGGKHPTSTHLAGGSANAALLLSSVGLARHYARYGIRINAINPGATLTERLQEGLQVEARREGTDPAEMLARGEAKVPLRRYAKPEEIANVVLFLASRRASYVTGAIVPMDGCVTPII